jgi:hypothetical protein
MTDAEEGEKNEATEGVKLNDAANAEDLCPFFDLKAGLGAMVGPCNNKCDVNGEANVGLGLR